MCRYGLEFQTGFTSPFTSQAEIYEARMSEAEQLLHDAVDVNVRSVGHAHEDVIAAVTNLARLKHIRDKCAEATMLVVGP